MNKFNAKFQREFEVQIEADDIQTAEQLARRVLTGFPAGTTKLLSILPEGYTEPVESASGGAVDLTAVRNSGLAKRVRELTDDQPDLVA